MDALTDESFGRYVSQDGLSCVVFGALNCRPSRVQEREIGGIVKSFGRSVRFARIDALLHDTITQMMSVRRLPTTVIFRNGETAATLEGFCAPHRVEAMLQQLNRTAYRLAA
jgi:thioredoxin-like negative regulator of GroEL